MKGVGYFLGRLTGAEDDLDRISSPQIARSQEFAKRNPSIRRQDFIDYMDVSKNRGLSPQIIH